MTEVWKVCRVVNGTFWSAFADRGWCGLDQKYPLGKEAVALKGTVGFLCFATRAQAESFTEEMPLRPRAILRCTSCHEPEPINVLFKFSRGHLWQRGEQALRGAMGFDYVQTMPAPDGSVTVPSLTPVECVWERT